MDKQRTLASSDAKHESVVASEQSHLWVNGNYFLDRDWSRIGIAGDAVEHALGMQTDRYLEEFPLVSCTIDIEILDSCGGVRFESRVGH